MEWDDQMMDEQLRRQAGTPAPYAHTAAVWEAIERKRSRRVVKWYAAAAAIVVVVLLYFIPSSKQDTHALQELKAELDSTAIELSAIDRQLKLFGNDDQLLRARSRIQNHRTAVLKAITEIN